MIFKDISCGKKLNKFHSVYKIVHFFATPILIFSACFFGLGMLFASQPGYHVRETAIIGCCVCVMLAVLMAIFQHIFEKDDVYKHTTYPFMSKFNPLSIMALILLLTVTILPFYVLVINSVKTSAEANAIGFTFWPEQGVTFSQYTRIFDYSSSIGIDLVASFFNSLIYATIPVFVGVFVSAFAAYGFAKLDYPGRSKIYYFMIFTLMVPGCVSMSSSYVLFDSYGWTSGSGLSLPMLIPGCFGTVGTVMFLREYFKGIPDDMLAAARIDGCGKLKIFTSIMIPLGIPALIAQLVLGFIGTYNDYSTALIYLRYPEQYTIQLALSFFNGGYSDKAVVSASAVFGVMPLLVLYMIFQDKIISGISVSAGLKG